MLTLINAGWHAPLDNVRCQSNQPALALLTLVPIHTDTHTQMKQIVLTASTPSSQGLLPYRVCNCADTTLGRIYLPLACTSDGNHWKTHGKSFPVYRCCAYYSSVHKRFVWLRVDIQTVSFTQLGLERQLFTYKALTILEYHNSYYFQRQ